MATEESRSDLRASHDVAQHNSHHRQRSRQYGADPRQDLRGARRKERSVERSGSPVMPPTPKSRSRRDDDERERGRGDEQRQRHRSKSGEKDARLEKIRSASSLGSRSPTKHASGSQKRSSRRSERREPSAESPHRHHHAHGHRSSEYRSREDLHRHVSRASSRTSTASGGTKSNDSLADGTGRVHRSSSGHRRSSRDVRPETEGRHAKPASIRPSTSSRRQASASPSMRSTSRKSYDHQAVDENPGAQNLDKDSLVGGGGDMMSNQQKSADSNDIGGSTNAIATEAYLGDLFGDTTAPSKELEDRLDQLLPTLGKEQAVCVLLHMACIGDFFRRLNKHGRLTDVELVLPKCQKSFRAHKLVLTAHSDWLRSYFQQYSSANQIVFNDIEDCTAFIACIDYMYSGIIIPTRNWAANQDYKTNLGTSYQGGNKPTNKSNEAVCDGHEPTNEFNSHGDYKPAQSSSQQMQNRLDPDTAWLLDLLFVATKLGISVLERKLHKVIKITPAVCCKILNYAENKSCLNELVRQITVWAKQNIVQITKDVGWLDLPYDVVKRLLSSDDLRIDSESRVFMAAAAWLRYDINRRAPKAFDLLNACVRFVWMTPKELVSCHETAADILSLNDGLCRDLLLTASWQKTCLDVQHNQHLLGGATKQPSATTQMLIDGGKKLNIATVNPMGLQNGQQMQQRNQANGEQASNITCIPKRRDIPNSVTPYKASQHD